MISYTLIISGVILQIYSFVLAYKFSNDHKKFVGSIYYAIPCLIAFFIFGYLLFVTMDIIDSHFIPNTLLVSSILFLGAIFVIIILKINNKLIRKLMLKSNQIVAFNRLLEESNYQLRKQKDDLTNSKDELQKRTDELLKTMEDFYTLRLTLQKQSGEEDKTDVEIENEVVKKKLDELKK